jgi:antitoxin component YwqK of YwqJK toxin-antitoxin module
MSFIKNDIAAAAAAAADTQKHNKNILRLPPAILRKILDNVRDTFDYKNARLVCTTFYYILENIKVFNPLGKVLKHIFISDGRIYRTERYSTIYFNVNKLKYYLNKVSLINNGVKHGIEIEYDHKNRVITRANYKAGKLTGLSDAYLDNRLIRRTNYIDNIKHGIQSIYYNNYSIFIDKKYVLSILLHYKKYIKNKLVLDCSFKGLSLSGKTMMYYDSDTNMMGGNIKNILNFKQYYLHGNSFITQFDRILNVNYNYGFLEGLQTVFNIDNKIKFIGNYTNGELNGKYCLFNNNQREDGMFKNGLYDTHITINNYSDLSTIIYPLNKGILHGDYIERNNFMETTIAYNYGSFTGKYSVTNITDGETIKLVIYNKNNFYYSKTRFGIEYITLKKEFKKYTLTVCGIVTDGIKRSYEIDNLMDGC